MQVRPTSRGALTAAADEAVPYAPRKAAGADEARALAEADPAVKAGRLTATVRPWMVEPGHIK